LSFLLDKISEDLNRVDEDDDDNIHGSQIFLN